MAAASCEDDLAYAFEGLNIRVPAQRRRRYHKRHVLVYGSRQLELFLIDTADELAHLVKDSLAFDTMAVDLEGVSLGQGGEICIVQVSFAREGPVFLVDVTTIGPDVAFSRTSASLASLLESTHADKLFFDLRSDVAALWHGHGVCPTRMHDMQLHDIVDRVVHGRNHERVSGFGFIIDKTRHAHLSKAEAASVPHVKARAIGIFAPDKGGSWEAWKQRPLQGALLEYCTDARFMFSLRDSYSSWKGGRFMDVFGPCLAAAVERRTALAMHPDFSLLKADRDLMIGADPVLVAEARETLVAWKRANPGK